MRKLLLWASTNESLRHRLPRYRFVRRAVKRFMPGETLADALAAARDLDAQGIPTVFTYLGENVRDEAEAEAAAGQYLAALDGICGAGLDGHVSVKLTQLGYDLHPGMALRHLAAIARRAAESGSYVWVDMESTPYVDGTLELYRQVRMAQANVGVCLQAYLYRTAGDVESLLPLAPGIRLVKGAYAEPPDRAYPRRADVDVRYLALGRRLLEAAAASGAPVGIGTHDGRIIRELAGAADALGLPRTACEFQMLYGIRREEQLRLRAAGHAVRVLISYGNFWYPWYVRRLAERPANVWFVVRSMFKK